MTEVSRAEHCSALPCSRCWRISKPARSISWWSTRSTASPVRSPTLPSWSSCSRSMGRLTLNVLLSFAQFEREIAGERIRDKFAASRAKGMWMGGSVPLGYEVQNRKLIVNETEAETVRLIFARYLALGCVSRLRADLEVKGVRSKQRILTSGRVLGGCSFGRGALYHMLRNRIYRGEVVHKGIVYPGEHSAIVDEELWNAVQAKLSGNAMIR